MVAMVHCIPLACKRIFWITSRVKIIVTFLIRSARAGKYIFSRSYLACMDSREENFDQHLLFYSL